jgi:hypothetical protein
VGFSGNGQVFFGTQKNRPQQKKKQAAKIKNRPNFTKFYAKRISVWRAFGFAESRGTVIVFSPMTYEFKELAEIVNNFDMLISPRERNFHKKAALARFSQTLGSSPHKTATCGRSDFRPRDRGMAHQSGRFRIRIPVDAPTRSVRRRKCNFNVRTIGSDSA